MILKGLFIIIRLKSKIKLVYSINRAKHHFKISWPTIKNNLDSNKYINIHVKNDYYNLLFELKYNLKTK